MLEKSGLRPRPARPGLPLAGAGGGAGPNGRNGADNRGPGILARSVPAAMLVLALPIMLQAKQAGAQAGATDAAASGETQAQQLPVAGQFTGRLSGHGGPVRSVSLDESGTHALTASFDYSVAYWSLEGEGALLQRLLGHDAAVNDAEFVPSAGEAAKRAVSVSDDSSLIVWNLADGEMLHRFDGNGDKLVDAAVSPDGRYAAAARWDNKALVYDLETLEEIAVLEGHRGSVNSVLFSADSSLVFTASYDGDIRAWYVEGEEAGGGENGLQHGGIIHSAGWGVNVLERLEEDRVAFGAINGTIGIVEPQSGDVQTLIAEGHPVLSLSADSPSQRLAAGSSDGHIRVYSSQTLALIEDYNEPYGPVWGLAFAGEGSVLYRAGLDDFVSTWQVTPRKAFEMPQGEFPRRFQVNAEMGPGEAEFMRKCSVCHTLGPDDANRAGPTLHGVFGRLAGSLPDYPYSPALVESGIVWNEETIGLLFDKGPDIVTPGSKMPVQRLKSAERRDALVAFLKQATAPGSKQVEQ